MLEGAHLPGEGANSDAVFGVNRSVWSRCFGELLIALKSRRMLNRIRDRHTRNGSKAHEGGNRRREYTGGPRVEAVMVTSDA